MTPTPPRLEALVPLALSGQRDALERLCAQLSSPIYHLCLRGLGDPDLAQDATQEVLIKVITNLSSFEGRSALMTWVYRITTRHIFALQAKRQRVRQLDEAAFDALLERGLAYGQDQPQPSADELVLVREVRLSCTQGMLMMLTPRERLSLVLVELLGFDAAAASLIMECEHDALRKQLSRARAKLATFLSSSCGLVNVAAACRCERQLPAKRMLGLDESSQRYAPCAAGELPFYEHVERAAHELHQARQISAAFHQDGALHAPVALRARIEQLLPQLLVG